jgi:hypothetical protein
MRDRVLNPLSSILPCRWSIDGEVAVSPSLQRERDIGSMAMNSDWAKTSPRGTTDRIGIAWLAAAMLGLIVTHAAFSEEVRQPPQTSQAQPQPKQEPGVLESIAHWFEQGFANFKRGMGDAKGNIDNFGDKAASTGKNIGEKAAEVGKGAADATKGAVDAVVKLPSARVVEGRELCGISANGAPDCRVAARTICTAKGFAGGSSVDFVSAEKCPPAVWMNRRKAEPGECTTETFVIRAMCQ